MNSWWHCILQGWHDLEATINNSWLGGFASSLGCDSCTGERRTGKSRIPMWLQIVQNIQLFAANFQILSTTWWFWNNFGHYQRYYLNFYAMKECHSIFFLLLFKIKCMQMMHQAKVQHWKKLRRKNDFSFADFSETNRIIKPLSFSFKNW